MIIVFYLELGRETGDCGISREMFVNGYFVLPFNLTPSQDYTASSVDLIREGPTFVKRRANTDPVDGIEMYFFGKWRTLMVIDHTRTVRTDLSI